VARQLLVDVGSVGYRRMAIRGPAMRSLPSVIAGWQVKHRRVAFDVKKVATQLSDCGDSGEYRTHRHPPRHRYKTIKDHDSLVPASAPAIEVNGLVKRYGSFTAVDGISLRVESGEFFGFLGPNGPAKRRRSTQSSVWARTSAGSIRIFGYDNERQWREARRLIGLSPQEFNFDRYLSLRDVLIYAAGYYGLRGKLVAERADMLLERFGLTSHAHLEYTRFPAARSAGSHWHVP